jgi:hypothetical protein
MFQFEETKLWQATLAARANDPHAAQRDRLRVAFLSFRQRAELMANEIRRDLPHFTVHGITHLDALWEMADLILDDPGVLTPTDAFVLGGAFLTHDLGLGLAAYLGGPAELRRQQRWIDTLHFRLRRDLARPPSAQEVAAITSDLANETDELVLRELHGERARDLAKIGWRDGGPTTTSSKTLI